MSASRRTKVAHAIQEGLAGLIAKEVSDPRLRKLGLVSVNHVDVNSDLTVARVFVSFVGADEAQSKAAVSALGHAAGFLRGLVGRQLKLARAPELRFVLDGSPEMQARLAEIVRDDAARSRGEGEGE